MGVYLGDPLKDAIIRGDVEIVQRNDRRLKDWYDAGQDRRTVDLSGVPHENQMRLLRAIFSVDPIESACTETICQAGIEVSE